MQWGNRIVAICPIRRAALHCAPSVDDTGCEVAHRHARQGEWIAEKAHYLPG